MAQLTEEGEAVAIRAVLGLRWLGDGHATVVLDDNLLDGDAPIHISIAQEAARGEEEIDQRELLLDEPLANEELLRCDVGEALVTASRRLLRARFLAPDPEHLALSVADRQELMQRVDDRGFRKQVVRRPNRLVADEQRMLEMDDVRAMRGEEVGEVADYDLLVS